MFRFESEHLSVLRDVMCKKMNATNSKTRMILLFALVVCAVAIISRLLYFEWSVANDPLFLWPVVDEATYISDAVAIADNPFEGSTYRLPFWQPPGYTLILAVLHHLGCNLRGIVIIQQVLGVLSALLIYFLGLRLFGRNTAIWAAIGATLFAVCPAVLFYETRFLKPAWNIILLLLLLHLHLSANRTRHTVVMALLTGILCLLEAYFLILAAVLAVLILIERPRLAVVYATVLIATLAPVSLANSFATGRFMPISSNGGVNLFVGNNSNWIKSYNTLPGFEWKYMILKDDSGAKLYGDRARDRDALFGRDVLNFAVRHPISFTSALAQKCLMTISATETYRDIDMSNGAHTPAFNAIVNSAILALFIVALPAQNRKAALLLVATGLLLFVNTVFFPSTRYRLPMIALMCAGIPAIHYCRGVRQNLIVAGIAMVSILLGTFFVRLNFDRSSWQALRALQTAEKLAIQEDMHGADMYFQLAVATKPILPALSRYGEFLLCKQHDPARARPYLDRAIALNPDFPDARFHLALMFTDKNEYGHAYNSYSNYIHLRDRLNYPDDYDFAMLLEALYFCSAYQSTQPDVVFKDDQFIRLESLLSLADAREWKYNPAVWQKIEKISRIRAMKYSDTQQEPPRDGVPLRGPPPPRQIVLPTP